MRPLMNSYRKIQLHALKTKQTTGDISFLCRFVDRDMYMRYAGGGVGHYQVPIQDSRASVAPELSVDDEEGVDHHSMYHSTGITGHGVDGDVPLDPTVLLRDLESNSGDPDAEVDDEGLLDGEDSEEDTEDDWGDDLEYVGVGGLQAAADHTLYEVHYLYSMIKNCDNANWADTLWTG